MAVRYAPKYAFFDSLKERRSPLLLRSLSVIGPAVYRFSCDGVQVAPGLAFGPVEPAFLLFGELFIGDEFFHGFLLVLELEISLEM